MNREPDPQSSAPHRVEAYLDAVLTALPRLSAFEREELRRELRTHLWERVAAYEELGQTQDDAVTEALQQFGGGKDFVKQWRREWARTPPQITPREVWKAVKMALKPSLLGLTASFLPFVALQWYCWNWHGAPSSAFVVAAWALFLSGVLFLPVLVGARYGARVPERSGIGMTAALTLECFAASLLCRLADWAAPDHHVTDTLNLLMTVTLAWVPAAGSAAAISGWWTRRKRARDGGADFTGLRTR